ncbi:hypothetical protein BOTBODRAFT_70267 [Botryobasidium botryosum FD-172 SS1]|uniref:BTB domain-containing protein n=1 Tax=Botryobasidium botryosum (strain FD-172 SS1) TaxID=930990 RepID=A0A067LWR8_BOTB1|nr:hypothetical protein BOTBODRAFT_70267 [Botryobasidium botryosum FD-172 SS1]
MTPIPTLSTQNSPRPTSTKLSEHEHSHYPDCYFDDEFIVLAVGPKPFLFRISRPIICKAWKLRQMLEAPRSKGTVSVGSSDDHPIRLPEDNPDHFAGVMRVYHSKFQIPRPNPPSFDYVMGTLRVAAKYGFIHARDWAVDILHADWLSQSKAWLAKLAEPSREDIRQAIALINVSRELRLPEFLGRAFYLLCVDERWCGDAQLYADLKQADCLILRRGVKSFWHLLAEHNQGEKKAPPPGDDKPFHTQQNAAAEGASDDRRRPQTREEFVSDPDTMRTVFSALGFWAPTSQFPYVAGLAGSANNSRAGTPAPPLSPASTAQFQVKSSSLPKAIFG